MKTLFKYNQEKLLFERTNTLLKYRVVVVLLIILLSFTLFSAIKNKTRYVKTETEINLKENNKFNKEKLIKLIKDLNIKHPEIVYSQFVLESGNFKSNLFLTQNNLMGMRMATTRATTNVGEERGFAVYKTWEASVIDYALYQASFLRGASKEEYYSYLQQNYAEDERYVNTLKNYINKNNIKKLFY